MRILIEAQRICRANKGGMDYVALQIIQQINHIKPKDWEVIVVCQSGPDHEVLKGFSNVQIVRTNKYPYPIWEQFVLPRIIRKLKPDLVHFTANTAPLFFKCENAMLTLHDVIFLETKIKGSIYQKWGGVYRKMILKSIIKSIPRIVTISNYEKNKIEALFPHLKGRVSVINNGFSPNLNKVIIPRSLLLNELLKGNQDYFLHLGNKEPRKNTVQIVEAFIRYKLIGGGGQLVITNYSKKYLPKRVRWGIHRIEKDICFLPYVSSKVLNSLFYHAKALLFPSKREGFGLPVLEAMAMCTPVITSVNSPMEEVCGAGAVYVNPYSTNQIVQAMIFINKNKNEVWNKVMIGKKRSKYFTSEKMGACYLDFYKVSLLEGNSTFETHVNLKKAV